jgi:CRISPR-associated protein Csm3
MNNFRLKEIKKISGIIRVETGLHIGAGNDKVEIGGMDNPIIRDPRTQEPYIPGSSLKGKMRSLIEWQLNKVMQNQGDPCKCGECDVCRVFGTAAADKKTESKEKALKRGPTRIIVRDAFLSEKYRQEFRSGGVLVEEKSENSLNRITAFATPRPIERVVPGTEFTFTIMYKILDADDDGEQDYKNYHDIVLTSLALLQHDYLGGGGSRGNGRISFHNLQDENEKSIELPKV